MDPGRTLRSSSGEQTRNEDAGNQWDDSKPGQRDVGGGQRETDTEQCSQCGDSIASDEWHPASLSRDGGAIEIEDFCSDACRSAWRSDDGRGASADFESPLGRNG